MAISYHDPFEQLQRELETMLERAFGTEGASALYPLVNLFDAGADYVVKAELPGVEPADLELTVPKAEHARARRIEVQAA